MSLRDEIKVLSGNKRRFFLLRIADLDTKAAMKLVGITRGTYNTWLGRHDFSELYRRRDEFNAEFKQEAIQILRRDNQLEAVLLEGKIIAKMKAELDSGEYSLIRSHLAREVYSKLISDLDVVPQTQVVSWEQKIQQIFTRPLDQITEGEVISAESIELEADGVQEAEHSQGELVEASQQTSDELEEETQD